MIMLRLTTRAICTVLRPKFHHASRRIHPEVYVQRETALMHPDKCFNCACPFSNHFSAHFLPFFFFFFFAGLPLLASSAFDLPHFFACSISNASFSLLNSSIVALASSTLECSPP